MARRKDHTHDEIRALALEALQLHLQQQPADTMSLRKLAQAIGYSPATLVNVFGSYDHLLLSVSAITLDRLAESLVHQSDHELTAMQRLQFFGKTYLQFAQQNTYCWQLLFEHRLPAGDEIPDWQQQRIDQLFAMIEQALVELSSDAENVRQAARTVWASVHGICTLSLGDKLFSDSLSNADSMIESLIHHYVISWAR
ncbi:TetR/AcrR family transcriptional regulator [Bacterioplanoides sp. SCSIO 12839]|uniref:TetR/AcrR family transcriptional regulator n=1 Tax=Bacterioplanoides sp. SCSIO 12839 TaxID=2829569 RepID=UPI00210597AD|nr:TetR-like C-terminal domain-containing protein [Bacterioplanoides sp. SCSIO 12839]UTW48827.1 WHG domain-containing protein [Bacterioplanoides sp. SCSIO 12839]